MKIALVSLAFLLVLAAPLDGWQNPEALPQASEAELWRAVEHPWSGRFGTPVDLQLAEELRAEFPLVATLLTQERPKLSAEEERRIIQQEVERRRQVGETGIAAVLVRLPEREWNPQEVGDALEQLLEHVPSAPWERQPVLLLAADRLAQRLAFFWMDVDAASPDWPETLRRKRESPDWRNDFARWERYGLHFEENPWSVGPQDDWIYTHDLLWRMWREYPQSEWSELAFVLLNNRGWDTRPACPKGTDQFREVIQRGEEFLRERPASPYRALVLLRVAQAYETWWSLAQAGDTAFGDFPSYQGGAEAGRERAISYYEELLRLEAEGSKADYARAHLPRLQQRADTKQRQYFCVFQD